VRLATWNVANLFDTVDDSYRDEVYTPEELENKLTALARVLKELKADLVGLQEVENQKVLQALADRAGYPYALLVEGNDRIRGIDVAVLSRLPLQGWRSHAADPLPGAPGAPAGGRFSRDCLEVHLGGPLPMVVLVNHFKSRIPAGRASDGKRRAQARGVQALVEKLGPRTPVAVLGDLNDGPDDWALEPLFREPLHDVLEGLPLERRYSYLLKGEPVILDHILVNEALQPRVVPGSARAVHDPAVQAASDHFPLVVDLQP
jgi:endonuclease/exonuclease/phosphatase family metal-dependent hydrolase